MSCADDVSPDNGGRRTTQADCSSLTLNVKLDLPPARQCRDDEFALHVNPAMNQQAAQPSRVKS
jgi:hypothetical protein